ncbi:GTPase-activating protein Gyp7p [Trichomonascus vanleenenianus]|uniref:GTPase-activating protein GYP7 n=1 Tax=Trichomonascus vanleenenianus TaxID=2268995 RepID=UPI003EC9DA37
MPAAAASIAPSLNRFTTTSSPQPLSSPALSSPPISVEVLDYFEGCSYSPCYSSDSDSDGFINVMSSSNLSSSSRTGASSRSQHTASSSNRVQLLFSKSKVYVHPTKSAKDNIPGFIALVRPKNASDREILLSWIPESILQASEDYESYVKVDLEAPTGSSDSVAEGSAIRQQEVEKVLVAQPPRGSLSSYAFSVPLYEVYSIQIRPPSLGWWWGSLIVHTKSEETQPALFFHDSESESTILQKKKKTKDFEPFTGSDLFWGGDQFMQVLKSYAVVERSTLEPSIYLVNPEPEDRVSFSPRNASVADIPEDSLTKAFKEARWSILEKLARVTRFSRKAAQNVIDSSPPGVKALLSKPEVKKIGDDFDVARVYLAKWAMGIAEESERSRKSIVWNDGYQDMLGSAVGDFEVLNIDSTVQRRNEVGAAEWRAFFDHTGRLCITESEVKERIFHGGLAPSVRSEAWLFLLGVYPWDSDDEERRSILSEKRNEYYRLKRKWWDDVNRQEDDDFWKDQKSRIEKDVHRTDRNISLFQDSDTPHPDPNSRFAEVGTNLHLEQLKDMLITYNEYNVNLGYVQGMSDLLSPLYVVFQDDAIAFWAFCHFMDRMERNFLRDQSGMRNQLVTLDQLVQLMLPKFYSHLEKADSTNFFFFFRMLLVWYKREFYWDDVLRLWEVLWTDYLSSQFHLFIALAILDKHKDTIMEHLSQFDEILKYMNELSMTIDLEDILIRAEILFNRFKKTINVVDRRSQEVPEPGEKPLPQITDELRLLLSRDVIQVKEGERPPNAGGG